MNSTSSEQDNDDIDDQTFLSCSHAFDKLYFCYSPVHQVTEYYRYGEFDPCLDSLKAFAYCTTLKLKTPKEAVKLWRQYEKKCYEKRFEGPSSHFGPRQQQSVWQLKDKSGLPPSFHESRPNATEGQ